MAAAVGAAVLVGVLLGRATKSTASAPAASSTAGLPAVLGGASTNETTISSTSTTAGAVDSGGNNLSAKGTGDSTSQPFSFPGTWQLAWSFSCPRAPGPFRLTVDDAAGRLFPGGAQVNAAGGSGRGTERYGAGRNLVVKIATSCSWTVKLSG